MFTKLISLRAKPSEARRARRAKTLFARRESLVYGYGKKNKRISQKLSILAIWFIEQKTFLFTHIIEIRDEPARPARP